MRKYILSLSFVFMGITPFAQTPAEFFDQAINYYRNQEYDSALILFEKIYKKGKGDKSLIAKAYYNMAHIHMLNEDYKKAKPIFEQILSAGYDEMDKGGRGEGIMAEPYALYKNNSCKNLAEIALIDGEFSLALEYTKLFDKVYPYRHFCGNEYAANDIYIAYTYARCFEGLGERKKAIAVLLPQSMYNGLAGNRDVVGFADSLIKMQYCSEEIRTELSKAVAGIGKKKRDQSGRKYEYHFTRLFGTEIELYLYVEDGTYDKKVQELKESELYKYYFMNSGLYKSLSRQIQEDASFSLIK